MSTASNKALFNLLASFLHLMSLSKPWSISQEVSLSFIHVSITVYQHCWVIPGPRQSIAKASKSFSVMLTRSPNSFHFVLTRLTSRKQCRQPSTSYLKRVRVLADRGTVTVHKKESHENYLWWIIIVKFSTGEK